MKKRIMSCLVILSLLMIFLDTAESPKDHEPNRVEKIPLDEEGPLVPILQSHIPDCKPLKKCYDTEELKIHRQYCFDLSPPGHMYHCSDDVKENAAVEFFYKRFPCPKGYYASPEIEDGNVFLSCKQCPPDRFNPELRWSPENMDQCKAHYHKPLDEHAIEHLPGNSTHPAVSYCNFREGWASTNEELFCWQSYKPCNCEYKGESCYPRELLSDGSCHSWCDGQRLPKNNFQCTRVPEPQKGESSQGSGITFTIMTTTVSTPMTVTATAQPNSERSLSTSKDAVPSTEQNTADISKSNGLSPGETAVIVLVVCLFIAFIVGTVIIVRYKRRGLSLVDCTRHFHNTTNIEGSCYHIEGRKVHFNTHRRVEAAERHGLLGNESK